MVSFALGTDTAGAGRVPAAFNGIVGVKPTRGLVSTGGVVPACRDTRLRLDLRARRRATPPASRRWPWPTTRRPVLARRATPRRSCRRPPGSPATAGRRRDRLPAGRAAGVLRRRAAADAWAAALDHAAALGWRLVEIDFAPFCGRRPPALRGRRGSPNGSAAFGRVRRRPTPTPRSRSSARSSAGRARVSAVDAFAALRLAALAPGEPSAPGSGSTRCCCRRRRRSTRTTQIAADPIGTNARLGTYTNFVNLLDLCAIAVPAGTPRRRPAVRRDVDRAARPRRPADRARRDLAGRDGAVAAGCWVEVECSPSGGLRARAAPPSPAPGETLLAVVGAHLSGLPLNHQLTDVGATLAEATLTAPVYRLYELSGCDPPKPGLVRVEPGDGESIELEVWRISHAGLGRVVAGVRAPLAIGSVDLVDGSKRARLRLRTRRSRRTSADVTEWRGWRAYVSGAPPAALAG